MKQSTATLGKNLYNLIVQLSYGVFNLLQTAKYISICRIFRMIRYIHCTHK